MRKIIIALLILIELTAFFSCIEQNTTQKEQIPKVQVKTTRISKGYLPDYVEISGKTIYLKKNTIVAPISGYVTKVNVQQGSRVSKGKVLFDMQSPEAYVMQQNDSSIRNYGLVKIYSPTNGTITGLNVVQQGVYIDQGSAMCIIIASTDLKIKADVPFEFIKFAKIGNKCKIVLPDNTTLLATFSKVLPQMNERSQTVEVLAKLKTKVFIPENMIVKVLIDRDLKKESQILSKNCLLTDALMTKFWVMKLINDSVAVSVPVKIGNQTHTQVEILSPKFKKEDRIINEGGYGLADTSFVEVQN